MADIGNQIVGIFTKYITPLIPYAKLIILFIIPYYLMIGEVFAGWGIWFLNILPLPVGSETTYMIIAGVIAVIGLIVGILTDPKRKEKKEMDEDLL